MTYRGFPVYVVRNRYPTIAAVDAAIRPAVGRDVLDPNATLGVLHNGRCVPLSTAEHHIVAQELAR